MSLTLRLPAQRPPFAKLRPQLEGDLYFDESPLHKAQRMLYATDASVYQEEPVAVAVPRSVADVKRLVRFAHQYGTSLIPRAAGTSLAGQVVGAGIVVDTSVHFGEILDLNVAERRVRVQPGVIRDDLNKFLQPHGLMFGPETSTASRAMIGGMVGNNSCGLHSIVWGTTRDQLRSVKAVLSDGAEVEFGPLTREEFMAKCQGRNVVSPLEQRLYAQFRIWFSDAQTAPAIREGYPKSGVKRRNTGYAVDALLPFFEGETDTFNFACLIAGSEGTLCFITEVELDLMPLPPPHVALVCAHFATIRQSLEANLVALDHGCMASELVDDYILQLTKTNIEQAKNRHFVQDDPKAILMVEFMAATLPDAQRQAATFVEALRDDELGYAYPTLYDDDTKKPWALRKAGLSIMYNVPGDNQPANVIEDCAVDPADLPDYIDELTEMAAVRHGLTLEFSAHAGAGELHVLPLINLKSTEGRHTFRALLADTAALVKKYGGSLSGEHGDGRLRGEFIAFMLGEENYRLCRNIKHLWDPHGLFNPGKIVDPPPMNEFLRYEADYVPTQPATVFDFGESGGLLALAEKCSGSGDCRKTELSGGTMCPSYMATREEKDTTRARANILRHFYTHVERPDQAAFETVNEVMDLCLSCKGCRSECPSSVDITRMKAEFLQQQYDVQGIPLRARLVGNFTRLMNVASRVPWAYNAVFKTPVLRRLANRVVGFHPDRTMPLLAGTTLRAWWENVLPNPLKGGLTNSPFRGLGGKVLLFADEFTNYNDVAIGQKAIQLLQRLGYDVAIPDHVESGRTYLSKGLVRDAKRIAEQNVVALRNVVSADAPLLGIEPSAILTFRDEYPALVSDELKADALRIAKHTYLIEEWLAQEADAGRIRPEQFTTDTRLIKLHGHCHQKALSSLTPVKKLLSLPKNYTVQLIPSGCCGMAGSFGYEREHYALSMKIGELVLFPTVRQQPADVLIAAPGTSCRHQIHDGTGRTALHPVEILFGALRS